MAQRVLDNFFKPNQPHQFDLFAQRVQLKNMLNDFRRNLNVLLVEHKCALDIPDNDISGRAHNLFDY